MSLWSTATATVLISSNQATSNLLKKNYFGNLYYLLPITLPVYKNAIILKLHKIILICMVGGEGYKTKTIKIYAMDTDPMISQ